MASTILLPDTHVTPGNVHDSVPYLARLGRQIERFDFEVEAAGVDAGYFTAAICKGFSDRNVFGVASYCCPNHIQGYFAKREFRYNSEPNTYICPAGQGLKYSNTTQEGYREYASDPQKCLTCTLRSQCTKSANTVGKITKSRL